MNLVPSRTSLKKEPMLDRENFVNGHIKKFLAHVETREIKTHHGIESSPANRHTSSRKKKPDEKLDEEEA